MPEMFAVVPACLPAGCKPKWLRAVRGRETDKLVDATNQDGGDRRDPGDRVRMHSHRPAGATERAPEALEIRYRQLA